MRRFIPLAIVLSLLTRGFAQPTTAPSTQPGWEITITDLEGAAQGRTGSDQPWLKLAVGMKFPMGSEIRTGPRSAVRCTLPSGQTITLDQLATYKLEPTLIQKTPAITVRRNLNPDAVLRVYSGPFRPGEGNVSSDSGRRIYSGPPRYGDQIKFGRRAATRPTTAP